jgi:hypothetical protein
MNNEPVAYVDKIWIERPDLVMSQDLDMNRLFARSAKELKNYIPLYTHPAKTLTDEEIESWITEWAKDLYGTLYVEPTDHQRTMAIKMARAILRKAQEK